MFAVIEGSSPYLTIYATFNTMEEAENSAHNLMRSHTTPGIFRAAEIKFAPMQER